MDSENTKEKLQIKLKKAENLEKLIEKRKLVQCDGENCLKFVDFDINGYFCTEHHALFLAQNDGTCKAICKKGKNVGLKCKYKSKINTIFCKHHTFVNIQSLCDQSNEIETGHSRLYKIKKLPVLKYELLKKWFGVARLVYNKTIEYLNDRNTKKSDFQNVRFVIEDMLRGIDYVDEVPSKIKQQAINDACKSVNNAKKLFKETRKFQHCSFRAKQDLSQSISIDISAIKQDEKNRKKISIYGRTLGDIYFKEPVKIEKTCRLIMKNKRYFSLSSPLTRPRIENQDAKYRVAAIDPGQRNFISFYSEDVCGNIGINTKKRYEPIVASNNKLKSCIAKLKRKLKAKNNDTFICSGSKRKSVRRKLAKLQKESLQHSSKCTRLTKELHGKSIDYMCKNFEVIIIPEYKIKSLQKKGGKKVNLYNTMLSHDKFKKRLFHTARQRGNIIVITGESYTSKTCTKCGNQRTPSRNTFCFNKCDLKIDRDYQGARNIYIKTLR